MAFVIASLGVEQRKYAKKPVAPSAAYPFAENRYSGFNSTFWSAQDMPPCCKTDPFVPIFSSLKAATTGAPVLFSTGVTTPEESAISVKDSEVLLHNTKFLMNEYYFSKSGQLPSIIHPLYLF